MDQGEKTKKRTNPALVYCTGCGAPTEFDIVHQNYHCQNCGAHMAIDVPLREKRAWRRAKQEEFLKHMNAMSTVVYECPNCGAKVAVPTKEALAKCPFCASQLVRREFLTSDVFPEMVIPFYINRAEAAGFLKQWCGQHQDSKEAALIRQQLEQLTGFYLPYQLVKGPVGCRVTRDGTERAYHCGGYVDGLAVNTSKQLDNLVLDGMEPFDWEGVRDFDFAYLAGQKVKLQDVSVKELDKRVVREIQKDYLPVVEKAMETQGVHLETEADEMLVLPVLLPVYVLQADKFTAVVNGQTGRTAVSALELKKDSSYLRAPTLITLGIFAAVFAACRFLIGYQTEMCLILAGLCTVIFGLIAFTALADGRRAKVTREVFTGAAQKLSRQQEKLVPSAWMEKPAQIPVFFEKIKDQLEPVRISFYSTGRWIQWLLAAVLLLALPALIAYVVRGFDGEGISFYGVFPWLVLVGLALPALFMNFGMVVVFDYPIFKKIKENGSLEKIPSRDYDHFSYKELVGTVFSPPYRTFTLIMLGLLLFCSLVAAAGK